MVPARILIVDDSDGVRMAYTEILLQRGYEVVHAGNGEEALALLKGTTVDIAIIDIRMPKMGGLELRQNLLEIAPRIATILVSGYPEWAADLVKDDPDFESGRVSILQKPLHPVTLLEEVAKRLRKL